MKGIIEILVEEHDEILKFIERLKSMTITFMETNEIDLEEYRKGIHFIRTFADRQHHQKEEKLLFKAMTDNLGAVAVKLIQHGMLVEHDLARYHVMELEKAVNAYEEEPNVNNKLDIIANSMGYYYLLKRHAEKENEVVYPFAEKHLPKELMEQLDKEAIAYMEEIEKEQK